MSRSSRTLVLVWIAWAIVLLGFQGLVERRLVLYRPDRALEWTVHETARNSQNGKPYLLDPFMNEQVSWDSEFYLSIATVGYDDRDVAWVEVGPGRLLSMNYAFYPFYPLVTRIVAAPLKLLNQTPIATSTLAGVIVSLLGTLGAMFALYDLTRDELEESGGIRAAFYMLIFPSAFFLAQVYTEGLFAGLAFGCLALLHRKRLVWAALLAALATWTRAVGIALIVPLAITWAQEVGLGGLSMEAISWRKLARGLLVLSPLAAYLIWRHFLGTQFGLIEDNWFGRSVFDMERFIYGWQVALDSIFQNENPQTQIYFLLELLSVVVAFVACLLTMRRYPGLTLFGLAALVIPFTSGAPQSLIRYILAVPSLFIVLGRLGKHPAFDRAWTLASVLLLGMQTMLFTFDMWVA